VSDQPSDDQGNGELAEAIGTAFEGMIKALVAFLQFLLLITLQALRVVFTLAPGLARLAAIGAVIAAAVLTWPKVFDAYGAVPIAILPALCVILAPVAFALVVGAQVSLWGALVVAALAIFGIGIVIPALPAIVRALIALGVIGAITFHFTQNEGSKEHGD